MLYKSTRNSSIRVSAAQAIAQGISEEGGLFVPETFPNMQNLLPDLAKMNYRERAKAILKVFLTDYSDEEIEECVYAAYDPVKFGNETPAKLEDITYKGHKCHMLELWHGPTCAFKDMALQILPHLLTKALRKKYEGKTAVILVATSGDTGKAALEGFRNVAGTKIIVFYPDNGVSPMQLKQMKTQEGNNVCVCAVKGNFDDCQTQVKKIFTDPEIKNRLAEKNMIFSSANSINWGRLLPQIIYYFSAYLDLYNSGAIKSLDEKINVVVPTGNFGNILAAYYAKRMNLPINKLICASNANNVLTDFINTGCYTKNRDFYTTVSPSMDILVSSNLERLLYHINGEDDSLIKQWMQDLNTTGTYTVDEKTKSSILELFDAGCCSDEETAETIKDVYNESGYLCDTHTAVAVKVCGEYFARTKDNTATVIASTASPYKFGKSVLGSLDEVCPEDEFETVEKLSRLTGTDIPQAILDLRNKIERFDNKSDKDTIVDFVLKELSL